MNKLFQKKDLRQRVSAQKLEENPVAKNSFWHHTLKHERQLRGWSQADIASRIGSDPKTVSRWEQGLALPRPYFQQRLIELFGKDAQALGILVEPRENFRDRSEASDDLPSHRAWKEAKGDHEGEALVAVDWPPNRPNKLYYPLPECERDLQRLLAVLQDTQRILVLTLDGLSTLGKTAENADALVTHLRSCSSVLLIPLY